MEQTEPLMDVNLSTLDRIVRLILGTLIISLGYIQNDALCAPEQK